MATQKSPNNSVLFAGVRETLICLFCDTSVVFVLHPLHKCFAFHDTQFFLKSQKYPIPLDDKPAPHNHNSWLSQTVRIVLPNLHSSLKESGIRTVSIKNVKLFKDEVVIIYIFCIRIIFSFQKKIFAFWRNGKT